MPLGQLLSIGGYALSGGLLTKCVDWIRYRERTAINVMHAELARLRDEVKELREQVEAIRREKHDAQSALFVSRMNEVLLKVEVNEALRRSGDSPRYVLELPKETP